MNKRTKRRPWLGLLLLAAAVAGVYLWPQTPAGRDWLLSRAKMAAHNAGYDVEFDASRGNPWLGVALQGVRLQGHGLDLKARELELSYFLPSLLTGTLPLSIRAADVTGRADLGAPSPSRAPRPSGGGGGRGRSVSIPIRPVLKRVDIAGLAVDIENAPYTLPKLDLQGLRVTNEAGGLRILGTVATAEGSADLDAHLSFSPFTLRAQVSRADLTLGRHWWPHVTGGTARGSVTITGRGASADLQLSGGRAQVAGIALTDIAGGVHYNHPRIETSLTGLALGGPVAATGHVDIAARNWRGDVSGNAALAEAAAWLAEGRLPVDGARLPVSGRANVSVSLSGWQRIQVDGRAQGAGRLLNQTLDDLVAEFSFRSREGTRVTAEARYGGQALTFGLAPDPEKHGFRLHAEGDDLPLVGGLRGDLRLRVQGDKQASGHASLAVDGSLLGRGLEAAVDANLDTDGLRFFLDGSDASGAALEGAAVLQAGRLQGEVRGLGLALPWLSAPVNVTVNGAGRLTDLALSAQIDADGPRYLAAGNAGIANDLRGKLSAIWTGNALRNIRGKLGGFAFQGDLRFADHVGALEVSLERSPLLGPVTGSVGLEAGRLTLEEGLWSLRAGLQTGPLLLPGLALPALNGPLEAAFGSALEAEFHDDQAGVQLNYRDGRFTAALKETDVVLANAPAHLSGEAGLEARAPADTLTFDLQAAADRGQAKLHGNARSANLEVTTRPGLRAGTLSLHEGAHLAGTLSLVQPTLSLAGGLGRLEVAVQGNLQADRLEVGLSLAAGRDRLKFTVMGPMRKPAWTAEGSLPLEVLAGPVGLDMDGVLRAEISGESGTYDGRVDLDGHFQGQPFELSVVGQGAVMGLEGRAELLGLPLRATGSLLPALHAEVKVGGLGQVTLAGSPSGLIFHGNGTIPAIERAGLSLAAQTWELSGDTASGSAKLDIGASHVEAKRTSQGWAWQGEVSQPTRYRGLTATLQAELRGDSDVPGGQVSGELTLVGNGLEAALPVSGNLGSLKLGGTLSADLAEAALGLGGVELRGDLLVNAVLELAGGPAYQFDLQWRDQAATLLDVGLRGGEAGVRLEVSSEGLQAKYQGGALDLRADNFDVLRLFARPAGTLVASGNLARNAHGAWSGALSLSTSLLPGARATLEGSGATLDAAATLLDGALHAELAGSVLPALDLHGQVRAFGSRLELAGKIEGSLGTPHFLGTLGWEEFGAPEPLGLRAPAGRIEVRATLANGLQLTLGQDGEAIQLTDSAWSGRLALPFYLRDQTHVLRLEPSGTVQGSSPGTSVLTGQIEGPLLEGSARLGTDGLQAELRAQPGPWLPATLNQSSARLTVSAGPDLSWRAELQGRADLQVLPLELHASLDGQGAAYRGEGELRYGDQPVGLSVQGQGAGLRVRASLERAALEPLSALLPPSVSGQATGEVVWQPDQAQRLAGGVAAQGQLAGRPFDLALKLPAGGPELTGTLAGASVHAGPAANAPTRAYDFSTEAPGFDLTGRARLEGGLRLEGEGTFRQRPLSLAAAYEPAKRQGSWEVAWAGATLTGHLRPDGAGLAVGSELRAPGASLLPGGLEAELDGHLANGHLEVDALWASSSFAELRLSGGAWPQTKLTGSLSSDRWLGQPLQVGLEEAAGGYAVAARDGGWTLSGTLDSRFKPLEVRSEGELHVTSPGSLAIAGALGWDREGGFSGRATLQAGGKHGASAALVLTGRGGLAVEGPLGYRDRTLATLALNLGPAPWKDGSLGGRLELDIPVSGLAPAWPGDPLRLAGRLAASGSLLQPALAGKVHLAGPLTAEGELRAGPKGASLNLEGSGLKLAGTLGRDGWRLDADAVALDVSELLPQVAGPSLSAQVRVTQAWGGPLRAAAPSLALRASRSAISGELLWADGLSGSLDVDANLADLRLGDIRYRGTLTGTLALNESDAGAALSGRIEARALGLEGSPWALSGSADLRGAAASPSLEIDLQGEGKAQGQLLVHFEPARRSVSIESDLSIGAFQSDASIRVLPEGVQASGKLGWRDFRLQITDGEAREFIILRGLGRLASWQAQIDPARSQLSLSGPLQSIQAAASGTLELDWGWAAGPGSGLAGHADDVALGPARLGDLTITGLMDDARAVTITGDTLEAKLTLAAGMPWQLNRLELPLSEGIELRAKGGGTLAAFHLDAEMRADFAPETLPLQVDYGQDVLTLFSNSTLLSGHFVANLKHRGGAGWSGGLALHSASWRGVGVDAEGRVSGPLSAPHLAAELQGAWGPAQLVASLAAEPRSASLDGKVTAPFVGRPLLVRGRLGQEKTITLSTAGSRALTLSLGQDGRLAAQGQIQLPVGPLSLRLGAAEAGNPAGAGAGVELQLQFPVPGLAVGTVIPVEDVPSWLDRQLEEGLTLIGRQATEGQVVIRAGSGQALEVRGLRWQGELGALSLEGAVEHRDFWLGNLVGTWQGNRGTEGSSGPKGWPAELEYLPFTLALRRHDIRLEVNGKVLRLAASIDPETLAARADGELTLPGSAASLDLSYEPGVGPSGKLTAEALPLPGMAAAPSSMTLAADIRLRPEGLSGTAELSGRGGKVMVEGEAGWARLVPGAWERRYFPNAGTKVDAQLRIGTFDLAAFPWVSRRLPHLEAVVSGVAQIGEDGVVGQILAPDLRIASSTLPSRLEFNGTPAALNLRASLGDSRIDMDFAEGRISGLADLQRFPLQLPAEAAVGESGVSALATGSVRFDLPLRSPGQGSVRAATQRIRLERDGIVSEGNIAFSYDAGSMVVEEAEFRGAGSWTARGRITKERLDFRLSAEDANFTPLLSLVPRLAELEVGAEGSLHLSLQGTPESPIVGLASPGLELQLAGGRYRLEPLDLTLRGEVLKLSGQLEGLSPIRGQLGLRGGGRLQLLPLAAQDLQLTFSGEATVPPVGAIEGISGTIRADPDIGWRLESRAELGNEFQLSGDLAPLDLHLSGKALDVRAPRYFLVSSVTDADLRLGYDQAFVISGGLNVHQAVLSAAARESTPPRAPPSNAAAGKVQEKAPRRVNPLYEEIHFDDVRIRAPQEIRFEAGFGSAELSADLTLSGTAAKPALDGEVRALRGSVVFSGRDFSIDSAVATFDPSRGVYPNLDVQASTSYDKEDVVQGGDARRVEFVAPRGSSSFQVFLDLTGAFRGQGGRPGQPELAPELSSNALIQETTETGNASGGPRPLNNQELVSLLALGRLDLDDQLLAETGLAGSVAQSALDTAIDVFILSELQEALGQALGIDLLQIRTSPLSSLLTGGGDFSVSLQLGGYLNEDVFATYRIGRFTGAGEDYALTNAFNLRYDLAPLAFNLQGGVNFLNETFTPVPEFGISVDYGITPFINLGANFDLSSLRQSFGIGLNFRW